VGEGRGIMVCWQIGTMNMQAGVKQKAKSTAEEVSGGGVFVIRREFPIVCVCT